MPQIIANSVARSVAQASTEAEVREAIVLGVRLAENAGYSPGSENLFGEICDRLKELADAEQDQQIRERLLRAAEIVCAVADELRVSDDGGKAD